MKINSVIIIACWILYFGTLFLPKSFSDDYLVFTLENLIEGKVFVLFTALFMHANLIHLIVNTMLLYMIGGVFEEVGGRRKYLLVFFLGGALTFLLSVLAYPPDSVFVGASGSIFCLMSILAIMNPLAYTTSHQYSFIFGQRKSIESQIVEKKLNARTFFLDIIILLFFQLTLMYIYGSAMQDGNVGHVGHLIGFLTGILFGVVWSKTLRYYVKHVGLIFSIVLVFAIIFVGGYYTYSFMTYQEEVYRPLHEFLKQYNIYFFAPKAEMCNITCINKHYDYGEMVNGLCSCKHFEVEIPEELYAS